MTSSGDARNAMYNHHHVTTMPNVEPHLPSIRSAAHERSESRDVILPDDSASNAPHRRTASGTQRSNKPSKMISERQTERVRMSIRDNSRTHSQNPPKESIKSGAPESFSLPLTGNRPTERQSTVPGRKKKPLPSWSPHVSLIDHTKSPLAARISLPPLSNLLPESLEPPPLNKISSNDQESAILDDLLFVFMGYEGQYIRFAESYNPSVEKARLAGPKYRILPGLDPSLKDLTHTLLKMATYYIAIETFVEVQSRDEFGTINQALCASIRKKLKDYLILVAQLEHQKITNPSFTLHMLHLHTLPTSHVMFQLYGLAQEMIRKNLELEDDLDEYDVFSNDDIVERLREKGVLAPGNMSKKVCRGGNVLRMLTERLSYMSGDPAARDLLQTLLRDASRPYMAMLNEWLHHGSIKDPHAEFLIKERESIKREHLEEDFTDEYWEKRYTIRNGEVPPQLQGVKDKVLLAGKYLNVVRECGGVDVSKEVQDVPTSFDDARFLDNVNSAYAHANSSLLSLLLTTHALSARLRSLKHYFLLDRSDFFTYFLDLSESELKKPYKGVNDGKLQSLLDLVLRQPGSIAAQDPFKEDVKVYMNDIGLKKFLMGVVTVKGYDENAPDESYEKYRTPAPPTSSEDENNMTGYEALELKFSVPFPLSLVISSKTMVRYRILFRYLLSMRQLETLLVSSWKDHHKVLSWTNRSKDQKLESWKRRAWTLRSRMLVFVQQFTYYCTAEVIEPHWQALMARVNGTNAESRDGSKKVLRTVDELMADHLDFLDTCLKECMLMNSRLLKVHSKTTNVITLFANWTTTLTRQLFAADPSLAGSTRALSSLTTLFPPSRHHPIPDALKSYDSTRQSKIDDMLSRYEWNFNHHLRLFLDALDYYAATESVALSRLCAHLSTARQVGGEREREREREKGRDDGEGAGGGGGSSFGDGAGTGVVA